MRTRATQMRAMSTPDRGAPPAVLPPPLQALLALALVLAFAYALAAGRAALATPGWQSDPAALTGSFDTPEGADPTDDPAVGAAAGLLPLALLTGVCAGAAAFRATFWYEARTGRPGTGWWVGLVVFALGYVAALPPLLVLLQW